MLTADQNFRLLQEIEESRTFLLRAYQQNPKLLANAEARIQLIVGQNTPPVGENHQSSVLSPQSSESGISLVELIMFIVIVSVALAGILAVMNKVTGHSADTLVRKQALAIAESILEEVELMPFTFCDPDDANAVTAASPAGCTTQEVIGTEGGEGRYANPTFDNVSDYDTFGMAAGSILDITGTNTGLNGYTLAGIVITPTTLPSVPMGEVLQITVTVNGPNNETVVLDGYRTRYSPRSVP